MKKLFLIAIIFSTIFFSCSKKNKLQTDTLTIYVTPSPVVVEPGKSIELQATGKSAKSDNVDINPQWILDPESLGSISPTRGKKVTFTASANTGSGKIKVVEENVYTEVSVTITSQQPGGGGGGGGGNLVYRLFTDAQSTDIKFDTSNPPDPDGGWIGAWGGATLSDGTDNGEYTEGTKSMKCSIGSSSGGWWIQFGYDGNTNPQQEKDMSSFSGGYLRFDIKTTKDVIVKIEWTGGSKELYLSSLSIPLDNNWHSVSIPLNNFVGIDFQKIRVPAGFHTSDTNFTFYIDNVRWEK